MTPPLRAVVADDEPLSLRRLELGVGYVSGVQLVGAARDAAEARRLIASTRPDLALLDVRMPGAEGLELAAELTGEGAPAVIFVTAHGEYAVDAFGLAAVDYLLKPLDFDRLAEAVERARERIAIRKERAAWPSGMNADAEWLRKTTIGPYERELWISDRGVRVRVLLQQVVWFEAERDYIKVHTGGRTYLVRRPLRTLAERLDPNQFLRLHRSALVNSSTVAKLVRGDNGKLAAVLSSGDTIPVGRKYLHAVRDHLGV